MIKHILLAGVMTLSGIFVNAQPTAKSLILGGYIDISSEQQKIAEYDQKDQYTTFRILPQIGYLLNDHVAIGVQAGMSFLKRDLHRNSDYYDRSENSVIVCPFMRYYLNRGKVGAFAEGSFYFGYGFIKQTENDITEKGNSTQILFGVSPGIYIAVHPKIMVDLSAGWLGYQYNSRKIDSYKETYSQLGFDFSTSGLSLGLTFIL